MIRNRYRAHSEFELSIAKLTRGSTSAGVKSFGDRSVIFVTSEASPRRGALNESDGERIAQGARLALESRLPLVMILSTSGAEITDGIGALNGWGLAAREIAKCSGNIPILAGLIGPAVSGPTLLLGLADYVCVTSDSFAFLSGPQMVSSFTGVELSNEDLGGANVLLSKSGVAYDIAEDPDEVLEKITELLSYLPNNTDTLPTRSSNFDGNRAYVEELDQIIPPEPTSSYDVREIVKGIVDYGEYLELRRHWAPQLVTALARVEGRPVGIVANQPMIMAGTLDIPAAQKGARFVRFCDSFNIPILTFEDTPGFLPGKDVEWRGMIRHGAELAFSYAACSVPRVCIITRKAYGGAYIVMDSKGMGNDFTIAWPTSEIAVMGAQGAVQILYRKASDEEQIDLKQSYENTYLTPWIAAERGFVDAVIEPGETRAAVAKALDLLITKKERLRPAKHANSPM